MNAILNSIDYEIETVESKLTQLACPSAAHTEATAFLDGLRVARSITARHMANWFNRKLSSEDVSAIRRRAKSGEKQIDLANEYGVSPSMISKIISRKRKSRPGES